MVAPVPVPKLAPDVEALAARLAPLRAVGKRVVFTNGCFDLLHPGHVRYLGAAPALGDVLIAAVAPDVLVKGADWAADDIVGRDDVLARGGRVERIDLVPGVSTSELIRRIRSG